MIARFVSREGNLVFLAIRRRPAAGAGHGEHALGIAHARLQHTLLAAHNAVARLIAAKWKDLCISIGLPWDQNSLE